MSAAGTTDVLKYALASLSASGSNWGNVVGTDTETGTGTGLAQTLTVYGSVAANQYIAPAAYTDTVTATISY
jgi:spore coat protein U-like protein